MSYANRETTPCQPVVEEYLGEQNISRPNSIRQLNELEIGQAGLIVSIKMKCDDAMREVISMGISPHVLVRMVDNRKSHLIFMVDGRKFVSDQEIAAGILVRPIGRV